MAFSISKTGWIYAVIIQRDRPISPFQKIVIKYISWFVLGMGYLILWQYEVDAALHMRKAWQGLLALWALAMIWMAVRALRQSAALSSDYGASEGTSGDWQKRN